MLETTIGIGCLVLAVILYGIYRYTNENVYAKYKDQRVGK